MYPFYLQSNMLYFHSQEQFLLALNNSCNSNTLWLNFGEIPEHLEHLQDVLLLLLKTGKFQHEMRIQDMLMGYDNFNEYYTRNNTLVMVAKSGQIWNGQEHFTYQELNHDEVREHWFDALTAQGKLYYPSTLGTALPKQDAEILINQAFTDFNKADSAWKCFLIEPNFLYNIEEEIDSMYSCLGYFEQCGRDVAMAFIFERELCILLMNGYS